MYRSKNFDNTKHNAVKHGMTTSLPVMLPHEDAEEYEKLCKSIKNMVPLKIVWKICWRENNFALRLQRGAIAEGKLSSRMLSQGY